MPKPLIYLAIIAIVLASLPPALIARARHAKSDRPRIHLVQDMDAQAKFKPQSANPLFADGRAMRPLVDGTVARGELRDDDHLALGTAADGWATTMPAQIPMTQSLLERGQERFGIYCSPCHGFAGYGDGIVHQRAERLQNNPAIGNGTIWVQPKSMHAPDVRIQPVGQIYNTITNGIRNMSGYAAQIPLDDRWAIAAYVKALQRSQDAEPGDVPASERRDLPVINLVPEEEQP
jgi:mono/diheme cytochrome c family protein